MGVNIVYVAFPDRPDTVVPAFWQELQSTLPDYFHKISGGRHQMRFGTLLCPRSDGGCYLAPAAYHTYDPARDLPDLCREILTAVASDHAATLQATDVLIMAFLQDFLPGVSGMAQLPSAANAPYRGPGIVVDVQPKEMFFGLVAHEYAHLLGFQHPPAHGRKFFGDYCLMDAKVHRLVPLCVENLYRRGWLGAEQVVEVTDSVYNVALADMRRGGKVLRVFASPNQYFWVCNHQGSDYDAVYAGTGLLIWHIKLDDGLPSSGPELWDVESAAGLFRDGIADPVAGVDSLDLSPDYIGSAADFFQVGPPPPGGYHFGPQTNPSSRAYHFVSLTTDSLVQDADTGVALRITGQRADTILVDVLVPNRPPYFGSTHLLPAVIAADSPHVVECQALDDHRVERVSLCYAPDTLASFSCTEMEYLSRCWWRGTIPPQQGANRVCYFLKAWDASQRWARLPERGCFSAAVQGRPTAVMAPLALHVLQLPGHAGTASILLANAGDGLLLFQVLLLPEVGSGGELLSPRSEVAPHGLDANRWWDAAEVAVGPEGNKLGSIKVKNSEQELFVRQQWYSLRQGDRYLLGVQWKRGADEPRTTLMVTWPLEVLPQKEHYFAEPPVSVQHGVAVDEQGLPCTVMEARIALEALMGADTTWPRLCFFAQRVTDRPAEGVAVSWPPPGAGYNGGDLALLRTNAAVPWVEVEPRNGALPAGASTVLTVRCAREHGSRARIVLTTNDPHQPFLSLPLEVYTASDIHGHAAVYPNPFTGHAIVQLFLEQPSAHAEVIVYNLVGQTVRVLLRGPLAPGLHRLVWDGNDVSGAPASSGIYLVKIKHSALVKCLKVVRLR